MSYTQSLVLWIFPCTSMWLENSLLHFLSLWQGVRMWFDSSSGSCIFGA